jgi:hypothetical protein
MHYLVILAIANSTLEVMMVEALLQAMILSI